MPYQYLEEKIITIISSKTKKIDKQLTAICNLLQTSINHYDWVGFYFADSQKKVLQLKAYAGKATEHTTIPFGKGICGQVAISNQNYVVPDVNAQDNYIACSIDVKSEIVIPIFKNNKNIGQIDIDSHTKNAFSKDDEIFLVWVNEQVATIL
ncbi:MAG: GAF domain-containing protein [Flavobacteriales bacterium]